MRENRNASNNLKDKDLFVKSVRMKFTLFLDLQIFHNTIISFYYYVKYWIFVLPLFTSVGVWVLHRNASNNLKNKDFLVETTQMKFVFILDLQIFHNFINL